MKYEKMTPADLKNGMFGITNVDEKFVIVDGLVVYEDGEYDEVKDLNDNLHFYCRSIDYIFEGVRSFNMCDIDDEFEHCVWCRNKPVEMTLKDIEKKLGYKIRLIKED